MALGKGLDALWGDTTLQDQAGGSVTIPVAQIEPGLNQPRKHFDEEALAGLAESIRQHGIIQPLTVRRLSSGYYQIIAGERRGRAARMAGLAEVPAIVIEADDRMVMELGLIENLQREDLNPMEEAAGYRSLIEDYGLTQEEAAQRVRTGTVTYAVRDTDLDDLHIHQGDIIGLYNGKIQTVGNDVQDVTLRLMEAIVTDEDELITVYYGKNTKEDDAQALTDELASRYGDCDVEMQMGGQPLYYYLVSVE